MEREHDRSHGAETSGHAADTIVPVSPSLRTGHGTGAGSRLQRRRRSSLRSLGPLLIAAVLMAAVYAVFVWLPGYVAGPAPELQPPLEQVVDVDPAPPAPQFSDEELEQLRVNTERLLSQLLRQQTRVAQRSPASWAADEWSRYQALSREGDAAYLADEYWNAVPRYEDALALGEQLLQRAGEVVTAALAAADRALAAGEHEEAVAQFELVLAIEAEHAEAGRGLDQARQLPELLALLDQGNEYRGQGRLEEAATEFRRAIALDGRWRPARDALVATEAAIAQREFDALLSRGFAAIAEQQFGAAEQHFGAALQMRPDSQAAQDGLVQAEQGRLLDQIALMEARALAFELREMWTEAVAQYRAALQVDSTLEFARSGLERAAVRADLDVKISHLIDNPTLLFDDAILSDARGMLEDARGYDSPAGRLEQQIGELQALVELAATPVTVQLVSDSRTQVTLYRVGSLGAFETTTVDLRPGTYTAVGSRTGYRDVRRTFSVLPGRPPEPVDVTCVEPI